MNKLDELVSWLESNHTIAYTLTRIFLGVALFTRGWIFASNPDAIVELVSVDKFHMWYSYITVGHLIGGLSLILGGFTRLGAVLQVPILAGAVFFVHASGGLLGGDQSLELAVLVLFLLLIIFFFGPGSFSLDQHFKGKKPASS